MCTLSRVSRAGKPSFPSISAGKVSYSWAVYRENPPTFSWVDEGCQQWGTLIPVYSWHWHSKHAQNAPNCMECINYLSLLWFSLLLPNCEGSQSAFIYKFKCKNSNTHASVEGPPCPDMFGGGGESFKMAALLSEWCERLWNWTTTVDMCHVLHLHTNTIYRRICKCYVTYLLIEWWNSLFIQTWPSQQKRTLGDRTRYSAARRRPHRNDSASFTTTSLDLGGAFDHKNFIGGRLANCGRPWMTAREELLFTTRRWPWQPDAAGRSVHAALHTGN